MSENGELPEEVTEVTTPEVKIKDMDLKQVTSLIKDVDPEAKKLLALGWDPVYRKDKGLIVLRHKNNTKSMKIHYSQEKWDLLTRYRELKLGEKEEKRKAATTSKKTDDKGPKSVESEDTKRTRELMGGKAKPEGKVKTTGVMERDVKFVEDEHALIHELGRPVLAIMRGRVPLTPDEDNDPMLAAKKYMDIFKNLLKFEKDATILTEKDATIGLAKQNIKDMQDYITTLRGIFDTLTMVICPVCRKKALFIIGSKAFMPQIEGEQKEVTQEVQAVE